MAKSKKVYSDLKRLDKMNDADIQAGIDKDPDAIGDLTKLNLKRVRGPQRTPTKQRVTLRLSQEVMSYFKGSEQSGWQTRLNDHLIHTIKSGKDFVAVKSHDRSIRGHDPMTTAAGKRDSKTGQQARNKIAKHRNTYKYDFKVGNKIVHSGITNDLERREQEHQQRWRNGHIKQIGNKTTEDAAREWEETKQKTITPPRKR